MSFNPIVDQDGSDNHMEEPDEITVHYITGNDYHCSCHRNTAEDFVVGTSMDEIKSDLIEAMTKSVNFDFEIDLVEVNDNVDNDMLVELTDWLNEQKSILKK